MTHEYAHFIHGKSSPAQNDRFSQVFNPSTGEVTATVALASPVEVDQAVQSAAQALPGWSSLNPQRRARVMFKFKQLVEEHADELALMSAQEHGKVIAAAHGDLQRGVDVIEFACGIPQ